MEGLALLTYTMGWPVIAPGAWQVDINCGLEDEPIIPIVENLSQLDTALYKFALSQFEERVAECPDAIEQRVAQMKQLMLARQHAGLVDAKNAPTDT